MERDLRGIGVLVTRPAHQADTLVQLIEQAGGEAIRFPVLEILDPTDPTPLLALIDRLDDFDLAVFVSPNAVARTAGLIGERLGGLPTGLSIATVGKGSAREVRRLLGREPDFCPPNRFDSEALLALPGLAEMSGRRVVIFRGEGGREHLAATLRERGAEVSYAAVYRRARPAADSGALLQRWERGEIDVAAVTSGDGLRNLHEMVGARGRQWLRQTPIVTVSHRVASIARELGITAPVLVAADAADSALIDTLTEWTATRGEPK